MPFNISGKKKYKRAQGAFITTLITLPLLVIGMLLYMPSMAKDKRLDQQLTLFIMILAFISFVIALINILLKPHICKRSIVPLALSLGVVGILMVAFLNPLGNPPFLNSQAITSLLTVGIITNAISLLSSLIITVSYGISMGKSTYRKYRKVLMLAHHLNPISSPKERVSSRGANS